MKTVIIGDIHGCSRALDAILQKLDPDPASDRLILLGDLYDRGPDSHGVFYRVRELADRFGSRFVLLRGNHEDYLLREKLTFAQRLTWERVGRRATVRSFHEYHEKMEDTAEWLREHSVMFWKAPQNGGIMSADGLLRKHPERDLAGQGFPEQDLSVSENGREAYFQCVHAGIMIDPPEANDTWTLLHDHSIVLQNQYRGPLTITGHIGLYSPMWYPGQERDTQTAQARSMAGDAYPAGEAAETAETKERSLIAGAQPRAGDTEETDPVRLDYDTVLKLPDRGVICIDTRCGKGGRLTGMSIENGLYILRSMSETGDSI